MHNHELITVKILELYPAHFDLMVTNGLMPHRIRSTRYGWRIIQSLQKVFIQAVLNVVLFLWNTKSHVVFQAAVSE